MTMMSMKLMLMLKMKNDDGTNVQIDPKELFKDVLFLQNKKDKIPEEYLEDLKETYLDCLNNEEEKSKHVYFPMECLIDKTTDRKIGKNSKRKNHDCSKLNWLDK